VRLHRAQAGRHGKRGRTDGIQPPDLAGFKVPRRIVFRELPKTATGKIQKFALREAATAP